jgi:hypothetical protein
MTNKPDNKQAAAAECRPPRTNYFGFRAVCKICGRGKAPRGRSVPFGLSMCDRECEGYDQEPYPPHLWPGESEADFGFPVPL